MHRAFQSLLALEKNKNNCANFNVDPSFKSTTTFKIQGPMKSHHKVEFRFKTNCVNFVLCKISNYFSISKNENKI